MKTPMSDASCELLGSFFAIFANATRMRIFCALHGGARTVTGIAEHSGISIPNASQHLRLMRDRAQSSRRSERRTCTTGSPTHGWWMPS